MGDPRTITALLRRWHDGDQEAAGQLVPLVYDELRRLAESYLRRERDLALCRTELVHEFFLKLPAEAPKYENRSHFFGIAARLMRQILVDLARRRDRKKRQPGDAVIPVPQSKPSDTAMVDVLELDECLQRLTALDARKARLVELRTFGGHTLEEIADIMELSLATVKREWTVARLWLRRELDRTADGSLNPAS
jgi:RNA polymerase sigma factor (TIGR02999 family)